MNSSKPASVRFLSLRSISSVGSREVFLAPEPGVMRFFCSLLAN